MSKQCIIIGAGFSGLASAALLAKAGYEVTILEKNEQVGGRASVYKKDGYTFDMGPSWYLMPDVFERYFLLHNKKPKELFKLQKLPVSYRTFLGNKKVIDITSNVKKMTALFDSFEENGGKHFQEYLRLSQYQYETAMKGFVYKEYNSIFDLFDRQLLFEAPKMRVFESIDSHVQRFFKSDIARKILEYNIVFLGGNPQNTPALYSIMAHIDFNLGVWYPAGGIGEIVKALRDLCLNYGVKIKLNSEVTDLAIENNTIKKVKAHNVWHKADFILGNADLPYLETQLLKKQYQSYPANYWKKKTIAPSGFIVFLGLKGKVKGLSHHNLFLEEDWMKHFDQIFKKPDWPQAFSYYVSCPSKTDPTVAPKDGENLFILVPVAAGLPDTSQIRKEFYLKLIRQLEIHIGENIQDKIVVKKIFTINDFANRYNAYKGTALGLTHTLFQSAFFRPHIKSKKIKNFYYTGQYTHPGIGVPMALISAEIVTNRIIKDYANN